MMKPLAAVLADALRLDDEARATLAANLLESWEQVRQRIERNILGR